MRLILHVRLVLPPLHSGLHSRLPGESNINNPFHLPVVAMGRAVRGFHASSVTQQADTSVAVSRKVVALGSIRERPQHEIITGGWR